MRLSHPPETNFLSLDATTSEDDSKDPGGTAGPQLTALQPI